MGRDFWSKLFYQRDLAGASETTAVNPIPLESPSVLETLWRRLSQLGASERIGRPSIQRPHGEGGPTLPPSPLPLCPIEGDSLERLGGSPKTVRRGVSGKWAREVCAREVGRVSGTSR